MDDKQPITGNIGEWGELYALGFILGNKGIYGADENENRIEDLFYEVLEINLKDAVKGNRLYQVDWNEVRVLTGPGICNSVDRKTIQTLTEKLYGKLSKYNKGSAFSLESGAEMMVLLDRGTIKAKSADKKDIEMVLIDPKLKSKSPSVGFSIKSQMGSPATLVNASGPTNFIFEILDEKGQTPKKLPKLQEGVVKKNIILLQDQGFKLVFSHIESSVFQKSLSLIDSKMPEYLAKILLSYYGKKYGKFSTKMLDLVNNDFPESDPNSSQPRHKIKEFLGIMAFGMMPDTEWDGILTSLGGFLLVKKSGDVLCYYLYNFGDIQNFLLKSTKFDTPSRSKFHFGEIFTKEGRFFIKLNMQVRFIK